MKINWRQVFALFVVLFGAGYFITHPDTMTLVELIAGQCVGVGVIWLVDNRTQKRPEADGGS